MPATRLISRLREHDWLAAAIELVIVVAGILIALQVSNWNQDRVDRMRASHDYARLHADLLSDLANIADATSFWAQVTKFGEQAMAYSEHGARVDDSNWKTVLAYYQSGQLYPFELTDTTFVEMRSSSDLGLIADDSLRNRLATYYQLAGSGIRADILRHNPVYRMQIRGLTPWKVQQYIWEHCFRQQGGAQQTLLDCAAPISEEESATILAGYQREPTLLQNLRTWMSLMQVSGIILAGIRPETQALIANIETAQAH